MNIYRLGLAVIVAVFLLFGAGLAICADEDIEAEQREIARRLGVKTQGLSRDDVFFEARQHDENAE